MENEKKNIAQLNLSTHSFQMVYQSGAYYDINVMWDRSTNVCSNASIISCLKALDIWNVILIVCGGVLQYCTTFHPCHVRQGKTICITIQVNCAASCNAVRIPPNDNTRGNWKNMIRFFFLARNRFIWPVLYCKTVNKIQCNWLIP